MWLQRVGVLVEITKIYVLFSLETRWISDNGIKKYKEQDLD